MYNLNNIHVFLFDNAFIKIYVFEKKNILQYALKVMRE